MSDELRALRDRVDAGPGFQPTVENGSGPDERRETARVCRSDLSSKVTVRDDAVGAMGNLTNAAVRDSGVDKESRRIRGGRSASPARILRSRVDQWTRRNGFSDARSSHPTVRR